MPFVPDPVLVGQHLGGLPRVGRRLTAQQLTRRHVADYGGGEKIVWPGATTALSWSFGQPLLVDLQWANQSHFTPLPDTAQPNLAVSGYHAVFKAAGPGALMRLMDMHRPLASTPNALDADQQLLQFNVPVVQMSTNSSGTTVKASFNRARFYLTLMLSADDPVTKAAAPIVVPRFPQSAPEFGE